MLLAGPLFCGWWCKNGLLVTICRVKSKSQPRRAPMKNLTPTEIAALSKAVSQNAAKRAKGKMEPGEYEVDFLVRITASLKRGNNYNQRIVAKAEPWTLLVVALSHLNNVTVESIVREALDADPELVKSIKEQANKAMEEIKGETYTPCNGKVSGGVSAEKAEPAELAATG